MSSHILRPNVQNIENQQEGTRRRISLPGLTLLFQSERGRPRVTTITRLGRLPDRVKPFRASMSLHRIAQQVTVLCL